MDFRSMDPANEWQESFYDFVMQDEVLVNDLDVACELAAT